MYLITFIRLQAPSNGWTWQNTMGVAASPPRSKEKSKKEHSRDTACHGWSTFKLRNCSLWLWIWLPQIVLKNWTVMLMKNTVSFTLWEIYISWKLEHSQYQLASIIFEKKQRTIWITTKTKHPWIGLVPDLPPFWSGNTSSPACLLACLLACWLACLLACLPAALQQIACYINQSMIKLIMNDETWKWIKRDLFLSAARGVPCWGGATFPIMLWFCSWPICLFILRASIVQWNRLK